MFKKILAYGLMATLLVTGLAYAQLTQGSTFLGRLAVFEQDTHPFPTLMLDPFDASIKFGTGSVAPSAVLSLDGSGQTTGQFSGAVNMDSTLQVDGAVTTDSTLQVGDAATMDSTLQVDGTTSLDGIVTITANVAQDTSDGALTTQATTSDVTLADLSSSATLSEGIPAGSIVLGVTIRVTTLITGDSGVSLSIGDGTDADRWGTGIAFAAGTTTDGTDFTITSVPIYAAATDIVLTPNAGAFTAGAVTITVHYFTTTAPTS